MVSFFSSQVRHTIPPFELFYTNDGSQGQPQCQSQLLWHGIQSKVTAIAWHPTNPHVLAIGAQDGAIGIYDTKGEKNVRLDTMHAMSVSKLQWVLIPGHAAGEDDGVSTEDYQLFSACHSAQELFQHIFYRADVADSGEGIHVYLSHWLKMNEVNNKWLTSPSHIYIYIYIYIYMYTTRVVEFDFCVT